MIGIKNISKLFIGHERSFALTIQALQHNGKVIEGNNARTPTTRELSDSMSELGIVRISGKKIRSLRFRPVASTLVLNHRPDDKAHPVNLTHGFVTFKSCFDSFMSNYMREALNGHLLQVVTEFGSRCLLTSHILATLLYKHPVVTFGMLGQFVDHANLFPMISVIEMLRDEGMINIKRNNISLGEGCLSALSPHDLKQETLPDVSDSDPISMMKRSIALLEDARNKPHVDVETVITVLETMKADIRRTAEHRINDIDGMIATLRGKS